jgi:hypothetical protein
VSGVGHLELRELLVVGVDDRGERPQQTGPLTGGDGPPGSMAASVSASVADGTSVNGSAVTGLIRIVVMT